MNRPPNLEITTLIEQHVNESIQEVIQWRRHLHQNPELSFQESETSAFVSKCLTKIEIPHTCSLGGHGIKGIIKGDIPSDRVLALRADMDALPIEERSDVPYKSTRAGIMHACGHDVHTANLLGCAKILQQLKSKIAGTIVLIFQPAEERLPGGASLMIKDGVLANPKPDAILGLHVYPQMSVGKIGVRAGQYMASTDELYLTVTGKGGHGALPHNTIDPILVSAHILVAAQSIISRNTDPISPCVLTFGKINSIGGSTNIIPDEVMLEGTFRTMDEHWRYQAHKLLRQLVVSTAQAFGAHAELRIEKGYPVLYNDEHLTAFVKHSAKETIGIVNVEELDMRMTAEDFAYYSKEIPACFFRLGTASKDGKFSSALHTPYFDVDEQCLITGMKTMVKASIDFLHE
jgi:amidohydrolase